MDSYGSEYVLLHVGLDDIDSIFNGCTTHFTYTFIKDIILNNDSIELIDYPNLVRLNPSIPFKTRGNGAVALRAVIRRSYKDILVKTLVNLLTNYLGQYDIRNKHNPGIALVEGDVPLELNKLYFKALTDYVHLDYVKSLIRRLNNVDLPLGMSRGVIGALAAIGWPQGCDCTYELLAYREPNNIGMRCVDRDSVKEADIKYRDYVFNNYDYELGIPLITPHGTDPVLLGIRGDDPEVLVKYLSELRLCEKINGWMIFRTNQGTDAHLITRSIDEVRPYRTLCVDVVINSKPVIIEGGHVLLKVSDELRVNAVFYKDTSLVSIAKTLGVGDELTLCGSVKQWSNYINTINIEKIHIKKKVIAEVKNPRCPKCGKRLKSLGRGKGFKCIKCKFRTSELDKEVYLKVDIVNKEYITATSRMKHLTKPLSRYGREKTCTYTKPLGMWIDNLRQ